MNKIIDVTAGIIWKDGKILITQRKKDDPTIPSFWEFPGGKIEEAETAEECLARELKEELDIKVIVKDQILVNEHEYPTKIIRLHFFNVDYYEGELKLNDHDDAKWIAKEEIKEYEFAPADIPVLDRI
jgi:8-oxo-dGTP diphosphatase